MLICSHDTFRAGLLQTAIRDAFAERDTHAVPDELPGPPADWASHYRKQADEVDIEPDIAHGYTKSATFLDPVLCGAIGQQFSWDPSRQTWLGVDDDPDQG